MLEHNLNSSLEAKGDKLCFDKNEFLKANFSVDEFLHKNRNVSSLELLRDNLGLYLKSLRASMIDLINEDYADFVSLSANLVGLDQSIDTIQNPLEKFRDEIAGIQNMIDENINEINAKLETKRQLRELKRNLQSLKKVYESSQKLEDLLANQLSGNQIKSVDLERAALELVQLKFNEKFCMEYLNAEQSNNIRKLESSVHQKLRLLFNESLKSSSSTSTEPLERCLRIYITLDACSVAETVFKEDVVAPYMTDIISEHSLQQTPQGLAGIYSKVLNFISLYMTDLLRLTQYTDKLRGFNFLIYSFWSDVEMRLETHMSSIFAPGNSEVFYAKYKCTRDFLNKIEEILVAEETINAFRQHKQTKSFQARWNLPVYFQICFQEIAGQFESVLEPILSEDSLNNSSEHYELKPFTRAQHAITRCWSEGVYLPEVFPKFYKLHIQIILRLSHWINDALNVIISKNGLNSMQNKKTNLLVSLHSDIHKLIALLPQQQELVIQSLSGSSSVQQKVQQRQMVKDSIAKSFDDLNETLSKHLIAIQQALIDNLILGCGPENVKQVNDLPRLYRKTNRDVPTRCSAYVEQMLKPLKSFSEEYEEKLTKDVVKKVLASVLNKITKDYLLAVNEVLTSVQKTEESLRRLRNLKGGGGSSTALVNQAGSSAAMSDDDKIRLQLRVDVSSWTNELSKLDFMPSDVEKLLELNSTVEESIKGK
ncbi:conserved oligomeric Golgi complex subunit 2 [Lucilia cuprina]|uniref:conserved oligomeric Golgi complex subunit 2 n=1 Tax=Lucilia cuprina TaxID=7375 RepID=UPI001F064792|nr:conserved oligomeric Golgi complex subunit 2 [Lucilia cuprina]